MPQGSTFGSPKSILVIKATGAIEKFYSSDAGKVAIGSVVVHHWDEQTGIPLAALPGKFIIHPDHQEHTFQLFNGVRVREDIFVLSGMPRGSRIDPPAAYLVLELTNDTDEDMRIATYVSALLRGGTNYDVRTSYSRKLSAFVAWNPSDEGFVRVFGCSVKPTSFETTTDAAKASAIDFPGKLSDTTLRTGGEVLGIFHLRHRLKAGTTATVVCKLAFATTGRGAAMRAYSTAPSATAALQRTREHYATILDRAVVVTPDTTVNRGVVWAKANMLRVQLLAPTGWSFVNDPARSNNSVARDTSWFAFGADYITPLFARESLLWYLDHLEKNGMVPEYYDVRTGKKEDYGLNINDNTPLLIMALWHHFTTSGDRSFLKHVYPRVVKMGRYILSQRNDAGLVWCTATKSGDWGICGWRNVIRGYRLSGATTELNSECYAAFKTIAQMARRLRNDADAGEFDGHAARLRSAINEHLLDPKSGLYYLNIDLDGKPRSSVTSDLVFPVMFGVADERTAAQIIGRLSVPAFWSEAGIHTVPRNDINYGPTHGYGLLGGVWVGVTFWFAFAAANFNPEFMAYALNASFGHYSKDPLRNNTVPGQFSEWLHGETLANQGMMLSPWFPPRYLWAAIEGAAGFDAAGDRPSVTPRLAPDWRWLGVRNVQAWGKQYSWFVVRAPELKMYATFRFEQSMPFEPYDEDAGNQVRVDGDAAIALALRRGNDFAVLIGNTSDRTITTSLRLSGDLGGSYDAKSYSSLRSHWVDLPRLRATTLRKGIPIQVDRKGFCVIELREGAS